jgi:hypothetical protein
MITYCCVKGIIDSTCIKVTIFNLTNWLHRLGVIFNTQQISQRAAGTFMFYNHTTLHFPPVTAHYLLPLIEVINIFNLNFIQGIHKTMVRFQ